MKKADRYVRIYASVHSHAAVITLPHPAFRLWFDLRVQWTGGNNGRLLITHAVLNHRGWTSNDTLIRARDELLQRGLIKRTKYCGPNVFHKASMYALTDVDVAASEEQGIAGSTASHDYLKWSDGVLRCPPDGQQRGRRTAGNEAATRTTAGSNEAAIRTTANEAQRVDPKTLGSESTEQRTVVRRTDIFNHVYQKGTASPSDRVSASKPTETEFDRARQRFERRAAANQRRNRKDRPR